MNTFTYTLLFSAIGGVLSLAGGLLLMAGNAAALKKFSQVSIPFAAGALLAAVFLDLLKEGLEKATADNVLTYALVGVIAFFILERLTQWFHHHHEEDGDAKKSSLMIILADTLHNALDGVAIASAFLINTPTGIVTALVVAAHELPQEIGDFGLLLSKGMNKKKVIMVNVLSALATVAAALITYFVGNENDQLIGALLGLSAGFLLYVAASDLIPTIHKKKAQKGQLDPQIMWLLLGAVMVGLLVNFTHEIVPHNDSHIDETSHVEHDEDHQ